MLLVSSSAMAFSNYDAAEVWKSVPKAERVQAKNWLSALIVNSRAKESKINGSQSSRAQALNGLKALIVRSEHVLDNDFNFVEKQTTDWAVSASIVKGIKSNINSMIQDHNANNMTKLNSAAIGLQNYIDYAETH